MRRVAWFATLWCGVLLASGVGGERPGTPAKKQCPAAKTASASPAPRAFDPATVALPPESPEMRAREALAAERPDEASKILAAALPSADGSSRGRLRWLAAKAGGETAARTHLQALASSSHPLAPVAAAEIARRWPPPAESKPAPEPQPEPPTKWTPQAALDRGRGLIAARRYERAQKVLRKLVARVKQDAAMRCAVELELGRALDRGRERTAAAELLGETAPRCEDTQIKAQARYLAGRARLRTGDPRAAITQYEALASEAPEHTLADDALFAISTAHADLNEADAAREAMQRLVTRYPEGDMWREARMRLALEARARGAHTEALEHLDALLKVPDPDVDEGAEGRASYWRARTLRALGRKQAAIDAYASTARTWWRGYHGQAALEQLRRMAPPIAKRLQRELGGSKAAQPASFAHREELDAPGFVTAIELLRVGEAALAMRELSALGLLAGGSDDDGLWLVAALLHHAGAYAPAVSLTRRPFVELRGSVPQAATLKRWRIAYPPAFAPVVESAAKEQGIDAAFLRAIAREESSFNPSAVSPARAYGLVQLMPRTARGHARPLGLASNPSALKQPTVNLRIGARLLRELLDRYDGNVALVAAAYNAGSGAVDRWLRERTTDALDEWVERIPYGETRRYTRRVLQSYAAYAWLDTGKPPAWPSALPPR
jgi:soluble lytic murein transglycosylase